jgi:DNA-binding transcriptional ArsR family regulator
MKAQKCDAYHVFFQNLASPLKTQIISSLKQKPKSVGELTKELKMEQSKISHALANLRSCQIVKCEQKGKQRIYYLNKETILPVLKIIDKHRQNFCPGCKR